MPTPQQMLDAYMAAEQAILTAQSYRLGDRMVTRVDLEWVQAGRREWERRVAAGASTGPKVGGLSFAVARLDGQ